MSIISSKVQENNDEEEIIDGIKRAVQLGEIELPKSDLIIIKPNLMYYWDWTTGQTTSPILVGALIEYLRTTMRNDPEIIIGEADASAMKTRHVFRMLGYEKLAEEKAVKLYNLSKDPVKKNTTIGLKEYKLTFSKKLFEADLIINVPKLKYHRTPKLTCAMKNIFGAIAKPHKFSYHKNLDRTIVAANKIVRSDLILVDGLVALGDKPKIMKTMLLGIDALTMDKVCSMILGFNPYSVDYIKIAEREGLGQKVKLSIIGDATLEALKEEFPPVSYWKQKIMWGVQLTLVDLYGKIVGDTIPPILLKE